MIKRIILRVKCLRQKKAFLNVIILIVFVTGSISLMIRQFDEAAHVFAPPEMSQEELYFDMFMTVVDPYIDEAITSYYGEPLSYDLFGVDIQKVRRLNGYRTFSFEIELKVMPFIGAHNSVGKDIISLYIAPGEVEVRNFQHLESYEWPPHLLRNRDSRSSFL